jgi:hypothetical protein
LLAALRAPRLLGLGLMLVRLGAPGLLDLRGLLVRLLCTPRLFALGLRGTGLCTGCLGALRIVGLDAPGLVGLCLRVARLLGGCLLSLCVQVTGLRTGRLWLVVGRPDSPYLLALGLSAPRRVALYLTGLGAGGLLCPAVLPVQVYALDLLDLRGLVSRLRAGLSLRRVGVRLLRPADGRPGVRLLRAGSGSSAGRSGGSTCSGGGSRAVIGRVPGKRRTFSGLLWGRNWGELQGSDVRFGLLGLNRLVGWLVRDWLPGPVLRWGRRDDGRAPGGACLLERSARVLGTARRPSILSRLRVFRRRLSPRRVSLRRTTLRRTTLRCTALCRTSLRCTSLRCTGLCRAGLGNAAGLGCAADLGLAGLPRLVGVCGPA